MIGRKCWMTINKFRLWLPYKFLRIFFYKKEQTQPRIVLTQPKIVLTHKNLT